MTEYELVGGPSAGVRLTVQPGVHEIVMPVVRPLEVFRKVVPFRRGPEEMVDRAYYRKAGETYRWEGLIDDAWSDMAVTDQIMAEGGHVLRRYVREYMRRALEELAPDKEIDGIVWRIQRDVLTGQYRVRARVGPHRVLYGQRDRDNRREFGEWLPERIGRA